MNLPSKKVKSRSVAKAKARGHEIAPAEAEEARHLAEYDPDFDLPLTEFPEPSGGQKFVAAMVQMVLAALVVLFGLWLYNLIVDSAPSAERKGRDRVARLVEVVPATLAKTGPVIEAWGEVRPAQTLVVRPEISGTVTWVHPEITPGGHLNQGDVVARLDDKDLKLAVLQAEAEIADIEARIQIEQGQAALGERDLSRLSRNISEAQRNLVLRKPQMAQLEAELASAQATLEQAQNALARTEVRVPFDAVVTSEQVAPGAMINQGAEVATLVAADRFHVALAVSAASLDWVDVSGSQTVMLTQRGVWPEGTTRQGKVVRLNSAVSGTGRMAELIVEVPDPLGFGAQEGQPKLLLGSFVQAEIEGKTITGAMALDRAYLRDGDTVWVMSPEDKLEIREVEISWRGPDYVLVTAGLAEGERIVATALASFAPGMALRTEQGGGA